jgi:hypothetical protein
MSPRTFKLMSLVEPEIKADEDENEDDDVEDDVEGEESPGKAKENNPEVLGLQNIIDPQGYRPSEQEQALIHEMMEKYDV